MSPVCDERMLCEHVKHHTPEHLSVSVSHTTTPPAPHHTGRVSKGQNRGEGLVHKCNKKRGNPHVPKGSEHTVDYNSQ